jgi:pimeloyl-ACP methyl ester carboxylesterase
MKKSFFLFVFVLFFTPFFGQEILGSWAGELAIQGTKLPIIFNVKSNEAGLTTTMDSPAQKAKDIPVAKTTFDKTELTIDASNLGILYKGTLLNDKIEGIFSQGGMSLPLVLSKKKEASRPQTPTAPFDYTSEEVTFINPIDLNTLAGTLTTPKNKKNVPVVILITGSGQQNRDSEIFGHKSFWVVADDFTKKGIAVLRLDDRGIGGSNKGNNTTPTSQNFATDINAAVNFLALKGFKNIGLAGHSEGGMIAPVVASQNNKVKFVISLAGPGIPIEELLQLQSRAVAKLDGASEADLKMNEELNRKLYAIIKNPKSSDLKTEIKTILLEDLKKIPKEQLPPESEIEKMLENEAKQISNPWFVYFLKFNPDDYWSQLKIPVLALNGSLDAQVTSKENLAGIKSSLEKAKNKSFEIVELPNLNHLFQEAKIGSVAEYAELEQTISPAVLDKMSSWIFKL